jgi:ATP-dependent Clp protease ATP-binding subunit ClpC
MFDRFSERGLRALALAQQEARRLSHDHAGTEHILLGLLRDRDGLAAETLRALGINLAAVREQVEDILGRGRTEPPEHIPYTPRARRVLDLAQREASQLGHGRVGTEHLLLGLLCEGRNVAAQVVTTLGGDLNRVRQQVLQLRSVANHGVANHGAAQHMAAHDGAA